MRNGGRILIAGGETSKDLPKQITEHPQIIIWDDNQQGLDQKIIPTNVRIIMYNRLISHATAKRLSNAAADLHAIKFPMLRNREIKELLYTFVQADATVAPEQVEPIVEQIIKEEVAIESANLEKVEEIMPAKKERGWLRKFAMRNINLNLDYTIKGTVVKEAARLFDIAKKDGVKTTLASMNQAIYVIVKEVRDNKSKSDNTNKGMFKTLHGEGQSLSSHVKPTKAKSASVDDFTELEKLIQDAIVAMKLVQEHLPKVRKETERLRGLREKFLKLLE